MTMSTITTMTTVRHRARRAVWSRLPFSTVQFVCIQGVLRSLRCRSSMVGLHNDVIPLVICYSVILEVALHDYAFSQKSSILLLF